MATYGLLNAQITLSFHIYCIGKILFHMCNNVFFNGSNGTKVKISVIIWVNLVLCVQI